MSLGGNKNLINYFQHYDLNEDPLLMKYKTRAAEYYRKKLKFLAEG